jgi:hypothetical protein
LTNVANTAQQSAVLVFDLRSARVVTRGLDPPKRESEKSMNPGELLRIVDAIHREKNIDKEIVFQGIEAALVSAAKKHYGEDQEVILRINRDDGSISGTHNGVPLAPNEIS